MPIRRDHSYGTNAHLDDDGNPRIIVRKFVVERECDGMRVDHYLKRKIPRLSRNRIQTTIKDNLKIDGVGGHKPNRKVWFGSEVEFNREAKPEPPCPREIPILFEDHWLLVLNKPAGLPMHASAKFYYNTVTRVISERYPEKNAQICHRLDRETSGIVVMAKTKEAAAKMKPKFEQRKVQKTYLAVVQGSPQWDAGEKLDASLRLSPRAELSVVMEPHPDGQPSLTAVRRIGIHHDLSLIECKPKTGRQHQIRVHLADAGFPIVGDKLYAHGEAIFKEYCNDGWTEHVAQVVGFPRQALHAAHIAFTHPIHGKAMTFDAPFPRDMRSLLEQGMP